MRSQVKRGLLHVVKAAAAGVDLVRRPPPGVVVLLYHRVGARSSAEVDLPVEVFDAQMEVLAASGRVVPLGVALDTLGRGRAPTERSIVVTFDDGTADFTDVALPVLERHRIPVTLYVATEFIDRRRPFPFDAPPASWAGLAAACATGLVDIGSHTHRHRLLDRLGPAEVADELDRSIELIGAHLGRRASDFAYPKAVAPSSHADQAVRSRFRSAALGGGGVNVHGATDPYRLARSPIQRSDGMRWFRRKTKGGLAFEGELRNRLNRHRYVDVIE